MVRPDRHLDEVSVSVACGRAARLLALAVLCPLAVLCALAPPLAAQRLRGQVVLPDSATAAGGVIIVASDSSGRPLARALTSERGDFEMALPRAGRFDIRALRIGFLPTIAPAVTVAAGETRVIRIVLNGAAVSLAAVTVRGESVCRIQRDSGQLVASLWEEARKALTASRLTSSSGRLLAHWTVYDSVSADRTGRVMFSGTSRSTTGFSDRPFASIPADSLARAGYLQQEPDGSLVYFAPDAEVLLSESFAELHCFHVEPPSASHRDWVGVGFRPARERRGITDIAGTLWLDRESSELRVLELSYTPQPKEYAVANVGATVEFLRLGTGNWLVNRWVIRMPRATRTVTNQSIGGRFSAREEHVTVNAIQVTGGEVTSLELGRLVIYATAQPSPAPAPTSRTDSVRDAGVNAASATSVISCTPGESATGKTVLHGIVFEGARVPIEGATVSVAWQEGFATAGPGRLTWRTKKVETTTAGMGDWTFCGIPRLTPLTLQSTFAGRKAAFEVFIPRDRPFATVDVELPPKKTP